MAWVGCHRPYGMRRSISPQVFLHLSGVGARRPGHFAACRGRQLETVSLGNRMPERILRGFMRPPAVSVTPTFSSATFEERKERLLLGNRHFNLPGIHMGDVGKAVLLFQDLCQVKK